MSEEEQKVQKAPEVALDQARYREELDRAEDELAVYFGLLRKARELEDKAVELRKKAKDFARDRPHIAAAVGAARTRAKKAAALPPEPEAPPAQAVVLAGFQSSVELQKGSKAVERTEKMKRSLEKSKKKRKPDEEASLE